MLSSTDTRIIYCFVEVYAVDPAAPHDMNDFARSPITPAVFGLLAGYYIEYAIGLDHGAQQWTCKMGFRVRLDLADTSRSEVGV